MEPQRAQPGPGRPSKLAEGQGLGRLNKSIMFIALIESTGTAPDPPPPRAPEKQLNLRVRNDRQDCNVMFPGGLRDTQI